MTAVSGPRVPIADRAASQKEARTLRVVVVNGSPSEKSKTVGLVDVVLQTLTSVLAAHDVAVEHTRIDVYRLGPAFTGAFEREGIAPEIEDTLRRAEEADLLIAATPVFRGSYTGLFKHFFDLVDQYALANKPVFLTATGGGDHHALVLEHALRPLFGFFQSLTLPVAVFASMRRLRRHHAPQPTCLRPHRDGRRRRERHPRARGNSR